MSANLTIQGRIAVATLKPLISRAVRYYQIRGTEAHTGKSQSAEEALAQTLGAVPNDYGQHARYDLWYELSGKLIHILHHIGVTGSAAYESTAVHKEIIEELAEAARWGDRPPDMIIRAHRHRQIDDGFQGGNGRITSLVLPSWQLKPPHAWKIPGARLSQPQLGGSVVRVGEDGELYAKNYVVRFGRSATVKASEIPVDQNAGVDRPLNRG